MNTKMFTLWQGASYQDHLLQSYRQIHFVLQPFLIAIGVGLSVAILYINDFEKILLVYGLLVIFSMLGLYLLLVMNRLIKARAKDVDYYHNQIIEAEEALPKEDQVLTAFKVYQKFGRDKLNRPNAFLQFELTSQIRERLIEKDKGHTRKILDDYLSLGFFLIWICLHIMVVLSWI